MGTPKQEKLIRLLMGNYGKSGETKSLGSLMVEAGYSVESAKNPKLIIDSEVIQNALADYTEDLDKVRRRALKHLTDKKLEETNAEGLIRVSDTATKIHQLLTGGDTERKTVEIKGFNYVNPYNSTNEETARSLGST